MMKIATRTLVVMCVVSLAGCALPEKTTVQKPLPQQVQVPVQTSPVYSLPQTVPKQVIQPSYLDISDQEETIIVEEPEVTFQSIAHINDRIFEYGRKLDKWKELDSQSVNVELSEKDATQMVRCFRKLQNVLNGYGELRTRLLQNQKVTHAGQPFSNKEFFELQKTDIAFLEDACGRMLSGAEDESLGWDQREEGADLAQLETLIDRYSANREYEEVIQVWQQIPEFQIGRVHLRSKILFGNALMYLHQEEKAAQIYQQVVDQMSDSDEQATDLVSLRKVLADLYTASGNFRAAAIQYKKISEDYTNIGRLEEWSKLQLSILDRAAEGSPELTEYAAMLRNFLGFIPEQDGYKVVWDAEKFLTDYPYSPVASNVDYIKEQAMLAADRWFDGFFTSVDKLAAEKKFTEALELLESIPLDIIGAEKQIAIKEKNDGLLLAEAVEKETEKMALIQELQHQWNNGMLLAKGGRYDEAIVVFTNLLDTEYSAKAEEKIAELSLEAAKEDRKKAANLFIRFTKTTDPESRKKLLIESRRLLKDILVKYPGVEIGPKVLGNIERVEQEMNAIDPNLLYMADEPGQETAKIDGIDSVFESNLPMANEPPATPVFENSIQVQMNQ